jgi:hypothetical protein
MKKLLYTIAAIAFAGSTLQAQDAPAEDSKLRFGLRITPQPTWFVSGDKNNIASGAVLGFGFGLNVEYKFTSTAGLLTGIGGDFEGGKYTFRNDPDYTVRYWLNESGELVAPSEGAKKGNTGYHLKERKVNATFVSIPLILKMSTKEYGGLTYSGMFGGEFGVRMKAKATDTYYAYTTYPDSIPKTFIGELSESDIDISDETGTVPVRLGMNAGAGFEYRLGGSTSLFVHINFFRNFTNFMSKKSDFTIFREEGGYQYVRQDLKLTGIRINIGIMF